MRTPLDFRPCRTIYEAAQDRAVSSPGPAWGNAHRIQNDHDFEVARIEREAAQRVVSGGRP